MVRPGGIAYIWRVTPSSPALTKARSRFAAKLKGHPAAPDALARFDRWSADLWDGLAAVYPADTTLPRIVDLLAAGIRARSDRLLNRDRERALRPDWFQDEHALGYVAYADLFGDTLAGVSSHIDYLTELGVTYLHLMPLLEPRAGANDGGYAVADYRNVRSDLGTIDDLATLAAALHDAGIALTLDLVLNHVAMEHEWARRARAGEAKYRDYFHIYPDRTIPDQYERTLPEVFPDFAPGNFTWDEDAKGWVWTTFNSYQWDLNWSNPDVFCEFVDILLFLANKGVDCFRLDAIAFLWKRLATTCQNQPEVHAITQALRAAMRIAAPAVIFKAEAIVAPDELVAYLGRGEHAGKVSDLAYHNSLMVQIWSGFAARDGRLLAQALRRFPPIPNATSWATYLRCHDDIGWAIDDVDAAAIGWNGFDHRAFLATYFVGDFPTSDARGAHFQVNPATGDARTSGSAASLAGVEAALESGDEAALALAIDRVLCGYAMVLGFGGLPLLYMGDELGLLNDVGYLDDPAKAADNRWMHRPAMPWQVAAQRHDESTVAGRVYHGFQRLIAARKRLPALHAGTAPEVFTAKDPAVVVFRRRHPAGDIVEVYNLADEPRSIEHSALWPLGGHSVTDAISGHVYPLSLWTTTVPAHGYLWLVSTPA